MSTQLIEAYAIWSDGQKTAIKAQVVGQAFDTLDSLGARSARVAGERYIKLEDGWVALGSPSFMLP